MKCKHCDGLGRTKATEFIGVDEGLRDTVILCPTCGGNGKLPQTNEEWLRSCNTEQLAGFLSKIDMPFMDKAPFPCGDLIECNKNCGLYSRCVKDDFPTNKEVWVEWLKQPHKPIS